MEAGQGSVQSAGRAESGPTVISKLTPCSTQGCLGAWAGTTQWDGFRQPELRVLHSRLRPAPGGTVQAPGTHPQGLLGLGILCAARQDTC